MTNPVRARFPYSGISMVQQNASIKGGSKNKPPCGPLHGATGTFRSENGSFASPHITSQQRKMTIWARIGTECDRCGAASDVLCSGITGGVSVSPFSGVWVTTTIPPGQSLLSTPRPQAHFGCQPPPCRRLLDRRCMGRFTGAMTGVIPPLLEGCATFLPSNGKIL